MKNKNKLINKIESELNIKATASLQKVLDKELKAKDPEKAVAKKLIEENTDENTQGND